MAKTAYRRDRIFVEDLSIATVHMHNGDEIGLSPRRKAIVRSLNRTATPRQRQCLYLYYGRGMNQASIGKALGVDISTVSRTIHRGEAHAQSALELFEE